MRRNAKSGSSSYPGAHLLVIAAFWTSAPALEAQIFVYNQEASVAIEVQPEQNGKLTYAHTAASAAGEPEGVKLAIELLVRNEGASALTLDEVVVSFLGPPFAAPAFYDFNSGIGPGSTKTVMLENPVGAIGSNNQFIKLPYPPPPALRIDLKFVGYSTPTSRTLSLAKHENDIPGKRFRFPARASDLEPREYWAGASGFVSHHGGSQGFAHDMGVVGWDEDEGEWSKFHPGTSGNENSHYRVWGKPVYAMDDGVVVTCEDGYPDDPADGDAGPLPDGSSIPGGGNHWWIRHGEEVALYAHMKQWSLNQELCFEGAEVEAGDFLGEAGNSGSSGAPHLHIHAVTAAEDVDPKNGHAVPLHFQCGSTVDRKDLDGDAGAGGPWVSLAGRALPFGEVGNAALDAKPLIWPGPVPGLAEVARHGIRSSEYQNVFSNITGCGYMPVWIDGYETPNGHSFNAIFRPASVSWVARHGLTASQYQDAFDEWTSASKGYRPLQVESYLASGQVRYAVIFVKASGGPIWSAYHGKDAAAHQDRFDSLSAAGYHPVNISVVSIQGQRRYTALYEKSPVGSWRAKSFLTPSQYQAEFNENVKAGRQLVYLQAYSHNGGERFSAIFHSGFQQSFAARHGMTGADYQEEWNRRLEEGFLTTAVTGYRAGDQVFFAAIWRKP